MQSLELNNLHIIRRTPGNIPSLPYLEAKEAILGKTYELDVTFSKGSTSEELHKKYKNKPGPANILSFPYDDDHGEIVIHLESVRRQAPHYDRTYHEHLLFLFIHGMLHLKGFTHGDAMEREEEKYFKKYNQ